MKKQLLLIATFFAAFNLSAQQLENADFEIWQPDEEFPQVEVPGGDWESIFACVGPICNVFLTKSEGHSGYGAKIVAKQIGQEVAASPLIYLSALPSRPTAISFWYKSTAPLHAAIGLFKGDPLTNDNVDEIAGGETVLEPASEFTKIEIPIMYISENANDTITVGFLFEDEVLSADDYFIIDDVELSYSVTGIADKSFSEIVGSNIVTSSLELKSMVEELNVYNTSGIHMLSSSNTQQVDLSSLPEGLYMVTLKKGDTIATLKVLKK